MSSRLEFTSLDATPGSPRQRHPLRMKLTIDTCWTDADAG